MTEYLDTPISWGSEIINDFVPAKYKDQTKFLHPPEFSKSPMFEGTVDFDPGPGSNLHASNGKRDIYLSKFTNDGSFLSVYTGGGRFA